MKKLTILAIAFAMIAFTNCKDKSVSSAECTPIVQSMLENFSSMAANATDEEKEKTKMMLTPVLQKECESGKYDLNCLKSAKTLPELQTCKKP